MTGSFSQTCIWRQAAIGQYVTAWPLFLRRQSVSCAAGVPPGAIMVYTAFMPMLSPDEWQAVRLTLTVAARAVGFGLPVAVLMAWVLARCRFPGRTILNALVHLPMVLPPVVTGWLLLIIFGLRGPVGSLLNDWFGVRLVFTSTGATLACAVMTFPIMVRSVRLSLDSIDGGLEQAARTLGAGWLDRLVNITLPLASPGILVGAVVGYATCLGEFGAVITFAANIPGQTQTLPLAIYTALQVPGGEAKAATLSMVSLTLALLGLLLSEWIGKRLNSALGR
jgi:molybdate transport system permease protein